MQFTTPLEQVHQTFVDGVLSDMADDSDDDTAGDLWTEQVKEYTGLSVIPGFALIDTAAQHGTIGSSDYRRLCERLAVQGLKPRAVPTRSVRSVGVGGSTMPLQSAEIPIAIQGVSGLVTLDVVETRCLFCCLSDSALSLA